MAKNTRGIFYTLPNPFQVDATSAIIGHVSGRYTEISEIIQGRQSAIILAGAPRIGKSTLVRYLQYKTCDGWSWREEVAGPDNASELQSIQFVQVDLTELEDKATPTEQHDAFVKACIQALKPVISEVAEIPMEQANVNSLKAALRQAAGRAPDARYFVILDAIDRLGKADVPAFIASESGDSSQNRGLALLDNCNAIGELVTLLDNSVSFGVILVIKSLPRSHVNYQFSRISTNLSVLLARFKTMTLQIFSWEDAEAFLAQPLENFGDDWASLFAREATTDAIFTPEEQVWLLEQAGTSPYLLQQFCYQAFYLKSLADNWCSLTEADKRQIIEKTNEQLSTFFLSIWKRLQEAIDSDKDRKEDIKNEFAAFIRTLRDVKSSQETIDPRLWERISTKLRYILYNEGIVRFSFREPIHYPGASLRKYLIQKFDEDRAQGITRGFWITIVRPDLPQIKRLELSELEYLLLQTLKQHPSHCDEETLMKGAWGRIITRPNFSQRMYQLRKRLKEHTHMEVIENHYGGEYSLNHPEWFHLE